MNLASLLVTRSLVVLGALVLDVALGDPWGAAHPVRGIGTLAAGTERVLRGPRRCGGVARGAAAWIVVVGAASLAAALAVMGARAFGGEAGAAVASIVIVYVTVAPRDLARHAIAVARPLEAGDLHAARSSVSMIVGRDVDRLDRDGVARAAVESVAESFVDGVAAPVIYALVLGPAGAAAYRAINTLDSMFGHKDERYFEFGRVSARADDLAGFIPARLSGFAIALAAWIMGLRGREALRVYFRDRLRHESPNAAHPEAAFAGALGLSLGGRMWYDGEPVEKPRIGDGAERCHAADIRRAVRLMYGSTAVLAVCAVAIELAARVAFAGFG